MIYKRVDIICAMAKNTNKRPSERQVKRLFPQYRTIDECPLEQQASYLYDLYERYTKSPDPDIRDFIEFMQAVGELPRR